MRIELMERFRRALDEQPREVLARVFEVLEQAPQAVRHPDLHPDLAVREIHDSGIWELRVGFGLHLVCARSAGGLVVARLGSHDEIQRYLRGL